MRVTSIIENTSQRGLPVEHGLSLYIESGDMQRVLFDMGQSALFASNANALSLDIAAVNFAIVSHGHYDHGGGLKTFLKVNDTAKVFIHKDAFIATLAHELKLYNDTMFYTMHCTGEEQYAKLKSLMGRQIEYLSCGEEVTL